MKTFRTKTLGHGNIKGFKRKGKIKLEGLEGVEYFQIRKNCKIEIVLSPGQPEEERLRGYFIKKKI